MMRKDGPGWARTVSRDNLEGAGCTGQLASQGVWNWGGSDQKHLMTLGRVHKWGHQTSRLFQKVWVPVHSHQETPAGLCWSKKLG